MELLEKAAFGFGIGYCDALIYCEVIMDQASRDVYFNGRWITTLTNPLIFHGYRQHGSFFLTASHRRPVKG